MSRWDKKCEFSQDKGTQNWITSTSVSISGNIICAGSMSGQVFVFEKRITGGCWDHVYTWGANTKTIDVKMQKEVNPIIIDTELFPSQRKSPLLLTSGQQDIHIWFISDKVEPAIPKDFVAQGITFPTITKRERFITTNEVCRLQAREGNTISASRACNDGISFAYAENKDVIIGRLDSLNRNATIFTNENQLTRIDFNPKSCDILLAGDVKGNVNIIDSRVAPKLTTPTSRASCIKPLAGHHSAITECKYSPDGVNLFSRHPSDIIFWDSRNMKEPVSVISLATESQRNHMQGNEPFRCGWFDEKTVATGKLGGELSLVTSAGVIDTVQTGQRRGAFFFLKDKKRWDHEHAVAAVDCLNGSVAAVANGTKLYIYDCKP
ncbi:hypothetical protein TVAG_212220 [Trichomonas vaginalis G3]|uniref:Uncharacterized protein n=1 Tax=Trichomonas vaginalis (strain ATCC PRA-98 / G3) TaxID=412133 RepID=A2E2L2_TRIV3|nr:WD40 repeat-like family [Trichomonas vaginalis G3]EAY13040.1 hypothetical protein TVAG_212220 [Trichomonas vaginalis G3]KAI5548229.1 WD40 repeat-like family [Trichomonas vaginalis G3]|eukprot:XP_001325263.1 hypothetical protein [Trichomonas vaginalis G3]